MNKNEQKTDNYFSPQVSTTPKRRRARSSPEELAKRRSYCDTVAEKRGMELNLENISALLDTKLNSFSLSLPSREDFKSLERKIDALMVENLNLKREITEMKSREKNMSNLVENLINKNKSRNLIFRGLEDHQNKNADELVKEVCVQVLGVENLQLYRAYKMKVNKMIIAEFNNEGAVYDILKKTRKLKGSGIVIHKDLASSTRRKRGCLWKTRVKIMEIDKNARVRMRDNYFLYRDKKFVWDMDDGLRCNGADGIVVLKRMIGKDFTEQVERNFRDILVADIHRGGATRHGLHPQGGMETSEKSIAVSA